MVTITEPYTIKQIAARDNHRCGICHKHVDMRLIVPHPKAPTVDHIVPISQGGQDIRANVQLAHFHCNCAIKRTGGTDQLRLIG